MTKLTSVLGAIVFAVGLSSCSKDMDQKKSLQNNPTKKSATSDFLIDFYGTDAYTFGSSISTTDESGTYEVTEVILDGNTEARGYIATLEGSETLLYFMDVDRENDAATTVDVESGESITRTDLSNDDEYIATNEFDVMAHIANVNDDQDEGGGTFEGRKFIGKEVIRRGPCLGNARDVTYQHYFFWIKNGTSEGRESPC